MTISHSSSTRNELADTIASEIGANGVLEFQTSGGSEVATITFGSPAFGSASGGVITANSTTDDTNASGGTVSKFAIKKSGGSTVLTGTVTTPGGGGDIELSSTSIGSGDTVSLTSLTYEASA